MALLRTYGEPVDTDPSSAVLDQLAWAAGHVVWLRERIQGAGAGALVREANVWLTLYGQERDRLARLAEVAHRMGIEARQVELAERQGQMIVTVMRRIFDDIGLTPEQHTAALESAPRRLREMAQEGRERDGDGRR